LNQGSLEMSVDEGGEVATCSSIVPFSSTSAGPVCTFSENIVLTGECTCGQTRSTDTINTKR
jgi:hypothetical protein